MRKLAAVSGTKTQKRPPSVATVVTICTRRKKATAVREATAVSLPVGAQSKVGATWLKRLESLSASQPAKDIYAGRGFAIAREAAALLDGRLYVASAGLGLVPSGRKIPAYGLTVSLADPDSVASRISGNLDVADWFATMLQGRYSDKWSKVTSGGSGRILLALTNSYAAMIGKSLAALPASTRARLRIFGPSLADVLPASLLPNLSPHDDRIDTIMPGTKSDLPQRCLLHFVQVVGETPGSCAADFSKIRAALKRVKPPQRPVRPRCSDQQILKLIKARLKTETGVARTLRAIRHEDGVACEQGRFTRLYRLAMEGANT